MANKGKRGWEQAFSFDTGRGGFKGYGKRGGIIFKQRERRGGRGLQNLLGEVGIKIS